MESDHEEAQRDPGLAVRFWGYDRQQVDHALAELQARAVEAERAANAMTGVGELDGVGAKVDEILASAADAGETAARQAAEQAATLTAESEQIRREADDYATATRKAAEDYAAQVREEADLVVSEAAASASRERDAVVAAAEQEADQILRAAQAELGRVEASIEELRERRAAVLTAIQRLSGSLGSMAVDAQQGTSEMLAVGEADLEFAEPETEEEEVFEEAEEEWIEADEAPQPSSEAETDPSEQLPEPFDEQDETRELRPREDA